MWKGWGANSILNSIVDERPFYEGCQTIVGGDFDNAGEASSRIKSILKQMGLPADVVRKAVLVWRMNLK